MFETLAKTGFGMLYRPPGEGRPHRVRPRQNLGDRRAGLSHKYRVGETVYFTASNVSRPASNGTYQVIRLLPTDGDDCQYRIKSSDEAFERVAKESQLSAS